MRGLTDVARFRAEDPDEVVTASLACPFCLGGDEVAWALDSERDRYDAAVRCECGRCEQSWKVYVAPDQMLRLSLLHAHIQ